MAHVGYVISMLVLYMQAVVNG